MIGDTTSSTNGAGVTFSDTYNASAQLTTVTSSLADSNHPGTLFSNALYNGPGLVTAAQLGNGISESRSYNSRLWMTALTAGSVYSLSMTSYAPNGDILAANDSVNGNWTYSYDAFNRLISSNQNSGQAVYSYVYDRFGNRWQQNGPHMSSLSFSGNNNRMDGHSYDAAGNLLNDGSHGYTYDAENRISQVDGGSTAQYVYDAAGQRVRKVSAAGTVDYLYDLAGNPITELNTAGTWTRTEVYAGGHHLATYNGGASGQTYFIHADWLGTERVRSTVAGASYETCTSLPFGDWLTCSTADVSTRHFTGKERDSETGLDNFGARYDSSSLGRFMSPDWSVAPTGVPYGDFGDPQSLNLYSYAKNRPLTYIDRDGHCTEPLSFLACVAIGVAAVAYGAYELHQFQKEREKAENEAFQKSLGCTASNAQCTEGETRAYDKERLNTYGEGAIEAIEKTVPDATPPTTITGVVLDEAKGKAVDAMVNSAKKEGQQRMAQSTQQQQQEQQQPQQQSQQQRSPSLWQRIRNWFPPPAPPPAPSRVTLGTPESTSEIRSGGEYYRKLPPPDVQHF